jgi:hypothetical protein
MLTVSLVSAFPSVQEKPIEFYKIEKQVHYSPVVAVGFDIKTTESVLFLNSRYRFGSVNYNQSYTKFTLLAPKSDLKIGHYLPKKVEVSSIKKDYILA